MAAATCGDGYYGPLPETSRGNKYILVIADYFSKWSEAYPIPNMEAITVVKCLVNEFICRFGVPEQLPLRTLKVRSLKTYVTFFKFEKLACLHITPNRMG